MIEVVIRFLLMVTRHVGSGTAFGGAVVPKTACVGAAALRR